MLQNPSLPPAEPQKDLVTWFSTSENRVAQPRPPEIQAGAQARRLILEQNQTMSSIPLRLKATNPPTKQRGFDLITEEKPPAPLREQSEDRRSQKRKRDKKEKKSGKKRKKSEGKKHERERRSPKVSRSRSQSRGSTRSSSSSRSRSRSRSRSQAESCAESRTESWARSRNRGRGRSRSRSKVRTTTPTRQASPTPRPLQSETEKNSPVSVSVSVSLDLARDDSGKLSQLSKSLTQLVETQPSESIPKPTGSEERNHRDLVPGGLLLPTAAPAPEELEAQKKALLRTLLLGEMKILETRKRDVK